MTPRIFLMLMAAALGIHSLLWLPIMIAAGDWLFVGLLTAIFLVSVPCCTVCIRAIRPRRRLYI